MFINFLNFALKDVYRKLFISAHELKAYKLSACKYNYCKCIGLLIHVKISLKRDC